MLEIGALNVVGQTTYSKLLDLENIGLNQPRASERIKVELELREVLNILFEFVINNNQNEAMRQEFILPQNILIEEMCMKAIKYSLDLQMVPFKKFIILY